MRRRRALGVSLLVLTVVVGINSVALATHGPTVQNVIDVATNATYNMSCPVGATQVTCDAVDLDGTWSMHAVIKPASGPLTSLYTIATVRYTPLTAQTTFFQSWLRDMHAPVCAPDRITASQLATFVASVSGLTSAGNVAPLTIPNECALTGGMTATQNAFGGFDYGYWINSGVILPPTPTPSPSPTPTLKATPSPTATPTSTPSGSPTTSPTSSPSSTASPTPSPMPSGTSGPTPAGAATASSSASPEGGVRGAEGTAQPTTAPGRPAGGVEWAGSVAAPDEVSTDPAALGMSALIALLLLVLMGFVGELFNNTLEVNYERIVRWWGRSWIGRIGMAFARFWESRP